MSTFWKNFFLVCLCVTTACGGKGADNSYNAKNAAEAGIVAGIAVTAAVIQAARAEATPVKKTAAECCAICDDCSFPCGNMCLTTGNICLKPPGCACYDSQLPPDQRPPRSELPCLERGTGVNPAPVAVPMGVAF